ncbi:MAG: hypothetical protein ABW321_30070, partial [Polyangiales bacterium]
LEHLKQMPHLREATFIALTGRSGREDQQRAREAGFDHHIVKPPDLEHLRKVVHLRRPAAE